MADYDNPRPSAQEVGTTEQVVAKDNLITFDRFMNADSSETVTNRKGVTLQTPASASEVMDGYIDDVEEAKDQAVADINADVTEVDATKEQAITDISTDVTEVDTSKDQAIVDINSEVTSVEEAKDQAISDINFDVSSVDDAKDQAIVDMNIAVGEISAIGEQAIADFESDGAQAISDFESNGDQSISDFESGGSQAIDDFESDGAQAISDFDNQSASAISQAGYEVVGNFSDGVTVSNRAEAVYLSGDYEGFYVWTGAFPKTVTAGDSPFDEDGWMLAATGYVKQSSSIQLFGQTIDVDLSIPVGQNALSINPTVLDGAAVMVPSESQYVILGSKV